MIIDDFSNPKRKLTVSEASAANDYFTRRKSEEDRIAGVKAPAKNKKNPANTDYAKKRKQQDVTEAGHDHRRRAAASHDDEECSSCDGTGEGRHEGQSCGACGGSGVARGQYDHDDFDIPDKDDMYEDVAKTLPMSDAVKVLRQYGADHFKTTSNELHFYKNGRPFSVDLIWNDDATRSVSLSQLNSATRRLKGQGVAEAKQEQTYKVYIQDTDGSERLGGTFVAKSPAHTRELAKKQGVKNITSIELKQGVKKGVAEAFPNPGSGNTGSSKEDKRIAAALRKKHIPTTPNDKKEQGVAEGKPQKKADRYHINKDGKPATLASYPDKDSAVKDRDSKYPDAKVHQVGPRGKVKGEFEEGVAEGLSKRDQKDVAAIKAAIERLESQLKQPNADKESIQQSIAHERKRLALYKQGVAEGSESPEKEIERLKLRQDAEHGHAPLRRQAATQARIRELEKQIKGKKSVAEGEQIDEVFADQGSGSSNRDNAEYMKRRKAAKFNKSAKPSKPKNQQEYDAIEKYRKDLAQTYNKPKKEQGVAEGEYDSRKPFGVRYKVFAGREGRMTTREYWTSSEEKLQRAVDKIQALDNFYEIDGYSYPKEPQGVTENAEDLHIGDPVIITGNGIEFEGATGEIINFGQQHRFVVVDLYNHGRHSFHSSDVSFNEYAGSDDEEARMYDAGEFGDDYRDEMDEAEEPMQSPEQIAYNQLRAQWDGYQFMTSGGGNTYVSRDPAHAAKLATIPAQLAKMAAALKAKGIDAEAEYNDIGGPKAAPVDINQKYVDEVRMSAAQRLSTAWDRQRAKSDASLRRTPSSIPKKEEPKKADPVPKTVSEHRAQRRALMAQMLNSR